MHYPGLPKRLEAHGPSYRVLDVRLRESGKKCVSVGGKVTGPATAGPQPPGKHEFCLQALHSGPMLAD